MLRDCYSTKRVFPRLLDEDKVLDGHIRQDAHDAGINCPGLEYAGDDPLSFVISMNLKRRHLKQERVPRVAAKVADMPAHRPVKKGVNRTTSVDKAAKALNVSPRSVKRAGAVR